MHIIYVPGTALSADATLFSPNVLNFCLLPLDTPTHPHILPLILQRFFLPPSLPADGRPGTARAVLFPGCGAIAGCSLPPSRLNLWLCRAPCFQKAQLCRGQSRLPWAEGNPNCLANRYQMERSRLVVS